MTMTRYEQMMAQVRQRPLVIPLGNGFRAACWTGPTSFDEQSKDAIYAAIIEMASAVFGDDMSPYWRRRASEGYLDRISRLCIIHDRDGELVGWTGYHRMLIGGMCCVYADATGVLPRVRRFGLMRKVMTWCFIEELVRNGLRPVHWTMRTESPIVYHGFRQKFGGDNVYPNLDAEPPPDIREVGAGTAAWLGQQDRYRPATLRVEDAFHGPCPWRYAPDGKPLTGVHLESPDERDNALFRRHLRPEDAFIIVARSTAGNMLRLAYNGLRAHVTRLLRRAGAPRGIDQVSRGLRLGNSS